MKILHYKSGCGSFGLPDPFKMHSAADTQTLMNVNPMKMSDSLFSTPPSPPASPLPPYTFSMPPSCCRGVMGGLLAAAKPLCSPAAQSRVLTAVLSTELLRNQLLGCAAKARARSEDRVGGWEGWGGAGD